MEQGLAAEPGEEVVAVGRAEDVVQGVATARPLARHQREREQMQVVIAQHRDGGRAERHDPAHDAERVRAAIDEVAGQPQAVARRVERAGREQGFELAQATLDVADGVGGHAAGAAQCSRCGTPRRKAAIGASKCTPSLATIS